MRQSLETVSRGGSYPRPRALFVGTEKGVTVVCMFRMRANQPVWSPCPHALVFGDRAFLCSPGWFGTCKPPVSASWAWDYRHASPRSSFPLPSDPTAWVLPPVERVYLPSPIHILSVLRPLVPMTWLERYFSILCPGAARGSRPSHQWPGVDLIVHSSA